MIDSADIALRPVEKGDDDFLLALYASTRAQELTLVPWNPEQKNAFLRMQFEAQRAHYAAEYPGASHEVICFRGTPVGRLYLARKSDELHILDVTIAPERRNSGIGASLLKGILQEAKGRGKAVTIYVESFNPSLRFFERLGFQKAGETGIHQLMKATPQG